MQSEDTTPVTSAEQYIEYVKDLEGDCNFQAPETVIITFGRWHLDAILGVYDHTTAPLVGHLYIIDEVNLGVLGGFGIGAPAMTHRIEQLIALGVKTFILTGLAGGLTAELAIGDCVLCTNALSEDGVGHLYLPRGERFVEASVQLKDEWQSFATMALESPFHEVKSWSFPVIFKETQEDIERVTAMGCETVEMEVAALYAIAREKGVDALALFVISDLLAGGVWHPQLRNDNIKGQLVELTQLVIRFAEQRCGREDEWLVAQESVYFPRRGS